MKIYVFRRPDGSQWADYSDLSARPGYAHINVYDASTRSDFETLIKSPGKVAPERVRALAERALSEFLARGQQPPVTRQQHAVAVAQVEKWGLLRRLKWMALGR